MSVIGSISIKDNASSVLKNVRQEQTAFREDVKKTKKELTSTWDKQYEAKINTASAVKKVDELKQKVNPLKKGITAIVNAKDAATAKVTKIKSAIKGVAKKVTTPIIKLKDSASASITKVTGKLKAIGGKIFSPIVKLKDATSKGLSAIGGKLKSLTKSVVVPVTAVATAATAAVVGGAVSEGASLEQSIGGVETLFKGDAGVVKANADAAFKTAGLSANEYMEQVTSFSASLLSSLGGDTAKAAGVADMAMVDMADNANKFGSDIGSIQNAYQGFAKQNYTMLDNLKLGYGGTKEEMQRLLKDAGKLTGVKYNMDNLSDVYNAIHAVQEQLGVAGTTSKEASETFSGSFAAMKASAKNLLGNMAIGGDVTGSMESLVETASTFLFKNAVPMIGRVISSLPKVVKTGITNAAPKIKEAGGGIIKSLKAGMISILPSSMSGMVDTLFDSMGSLGNAFVAVLPQLTAFGGGMISTIQSVVTACMPALISIISTVQTMLPVILPVIQTVVSTIGNIIAQAAPVIAGLVQGIGTVITTLAPIFQTIFSSIGEKVGSVIGFVGERMGFIQEVIGVAAPLIGDILSTAWGVISPVMDIAINAFKLVFAVVQKVFPGIQSVIETVWGIIKPIVEGIGGALSTISDGWSWLVGKVTGESPKGDSVGKNASGDNNWKGGLTWVGENGAELVELPKGSRILPHKESVSYAKNATNTSAANVVTKEVTRSSAGGSPVKAVAMNQNSGKDDEDNKILFRIEKYVSVIAGIFTQKEEGYQASASQAAVQQIPKREEAIGTPAGTVQRNSLTKERIASAITLTIAKIADTIIIREEADIDKLANAVAKKVVEVAVNMP